MESGKVEKDATMKIVEANWDSWFIPGLSDFVRVPNLTFMVDAKYLTNGLVQRAMECVDGYINKLGIKGLSKTLSLARVDFHWFFTSLSQAQVSQRTSWSMITCISSRMVLNGSID